MSPVLGRTLAKSEIVPNTAMLEQFSDAARKMLHAQDRTAHSTAFATQVMCFTVPVTNHQKKGTDCIISWNDGLG